MLFALAYVLQKLKKSSVLLKLWDLKSLGVSVSRADAGFIAKVSVRISVRLVTSNILFFIFYQLGNMASQSVLIAL